MKTLTSVLIVFNSTVSEVVCEPATATHPAERHYVEGVATAMELVEEVAVSVMGCVVYLQLTARTPFNEGQQGCTLIHFKQNENRNGL